MKPEPKFRHYVRVARRSEFRLIDEECLGEILREFPEAGINILDGFHHFTHGIVIERERNLRDLHELNRDLEFTKDRIVYKLDTKQDF